MVATLTDLLAVKTPLENFKGLLDTLALLGFPNTGNWTTGTVPNTLLQTFAFPMTDFQDSRRQFASGGLLDLAGTVVDPITGDTPWLTLHADQVFNNQRFPAVAAEIDVNFTDAANQGPFTIAPGGAGVSVGPGAAIYRTINTANVILPLGGTVTIRVRAPSPGSAFNVPDGSLTFFAAGRLPGVTVNNPGPNSIKIAGTNTEGAPPLTARCRSKWALLSSGSTIQAYMNWSLYAGQGQVGKVKTIVNDDLTDPGLVKVYLASPAGGGVAAAVVTAVQTFIAPLSPSGARTGARIPETAKCLVFSAKSTSCYIKATIFVYPEYNNTDFMVNLNADISAYQAAFPIGGVDGQTPGAGGYVPISRITQLLLNRSGVALDPAQEVFNQNTQLGYDGITFFFGDLGLSNLDSVTFDTSNITLVSIPRPT